MASIGKDFFNGHLIKIKFHGNYNFYECAGAMPIYAVFPKTADFLMFLSFTPAPSYIYIILDEQPQDILIQGIMGKYYNGMI